MKNITLPFNLIESIESLPTGFPIITTWEKCNSFNMSAVLAEYKSALRGMRFCTTMLCIIVITFLTVLIDEFTFQFFPSEVDVVVIRIAMTILGILGPYLWYRIVRYKHVKDRYETILLEFYHAYVELRIDRKAHELDTIDNIRYQAVKLYRVINHHKAKLEAAKMAKNRDNCTILNIQTDLDIANQAFDKKYYAICVLGLAELVGTKSQIEVLASQNLK